MLKDSMNANATRTQEVDEQLDDRDRRALEEPLTVHESDRTGEYEVESGDETYVVNTLLGTCTCPDHEYRDVKCKHRRRVEYEADEGREVPAGFSLEQDSETHECETCAELAEGDDAPLECWECFRGEDGDETVTPDAEPSRAIVTDGGVTVREAADGAEVTHTEDTWSGPHTEYDKYGEPTGARYHKCRDCGREVLESIPRENVSHRDGCRFGESESEDVMTDGGRLGDAAAEANAIAGPETPEERYHAIKQAVPSEEIYENDAPGEYRGDGQPVGSPPPEVL